MLCSFCGRENRDEARFCDKCGGTLDTTVVREVSPEDAQLVAIRSAFAQSYEVESLLGRGGMGSVYKAREKSLDRHVAIKVISSERRQDDDFIQRFRREARLAARLRHPRIVSVHEVGAFGDFQFFSMDYIEGSTLRSLVQRRHGLPPEDAISIVTEICRAVAHAHGRGIIHRDLKPENVMIDTEGDVFVMDFGLARAIEGEPGITRSGVLIGSPIYMSPEQLSGSPLDERTDVYSLGLILYYCLTGEDLFASGSITGVINKHITTVAGHSIRRDSRIPENLHEPLISMLEEDPDRRARSAREILERLTLRRIVALGLSATGTAPPMSEQPTTVTESPQYETLQQRTAGAGDPAAVVAAGRRKARLRSLLDDM